MSPHLQALEAQSIYIIREAYATIDHLALLWSMGKDSTVLLWLIKKAFLGAVPFPVILLDTGMEMDEVYAFRDTMARAWSLDLINHPCPPLEAMDAGLAPAARAASRKTEGLKDAIRQYAIQGMFCGIRRDEQGLRAKERVFSPRAADGTWDFKDQPAEVWGQFCTRAPDGGHMRIHPLLGWSEEDIWQYIRAHEIPVCSLYFSRGGKRYRSLGEKDITQPMTSSASSIDEIIAELRTTRTDERAGRLTDSETEDGFEALRVKGYM